MTTFHPQDPVSDVILVKPNRFQDERGYFEESYSHKTYSAGGIPQVFVQDNHSLSVDKGVLRGMHFQVPPHGQDKLLRCTRGAILDVAVDIRKGSPTFGKHVAVELTAQNGWQLFVPIGFAHGFCVLEEYSEVQYKVTDFYSAECDGGIAFNDSNIGIQWPFNLDELILSEKDKRHPTLHEFDSPFRYPK